MTVHSTTKQRAYKVLVVDDSAFELAMICSQLEGLGYDVSKVNDGKSVIKEVDNLAFDIIFLDFEMPGMTGYETIMALKQQRPEYFSRVSIIGMSSSRSNGYDKMMLDAGADYFLFKPLNDEELSEVLAKIQG